MNLSFNNSNNNCHPRQLTIHPRLQRQSAVLLASIKLQRTYSQGTPKAQRFEGLWHYIYIISFAPDLYYPDTSCNTARNVLTLLVPDFTQHLPSGLWMYKRRRFQPALKLKREIWSLKLTIPVTSLVKFAFRTSTSSGKFSSSQAWGVLCSIFWGLRRAKLPAIGTNVILSW